MGMQTISEDIKRSEARNVQNKEFPYIWDKEEAEKIVEWFALLNIAREICRPTDYIKSMAEICAVPDIRMET